MTLADSINIVQKIKAEIQNDPNKIVKTIYRKVNMVLNKNKEFKIISDVSKISNRHKGTTNKIPDDITINYLGFIKYYSLR